MARERLYRSRDDRVLFGVAGGMAEWLDQDPAVVRLLWALFVVFGGVGLIVYIIAAIVVPEEPFETPAMTPQYQPPIDAAAAAGAAGVAGSASPVAGSASPTAGSASAPGPAVGTESAPGTSAPGAAPAVWSYPQSRAERRAARRAARGPSNAGIIVGLILILIGGWFLLRNFIPWIDDRLFGPALLIAIGILLVAGAMRRTAPPRA